MALYFASQFTFTKPSFTIKPLILNTYFSFAFNVALKVPFFDSQISFNSLIPSPSPFLSYKLKHKLPRFASVS